MDDSGSINWEELKQKANNLLSKPKKVEEKKVNNTALNQTKANVTKVAEKSSDDKFTAIGKSVVKGYEKMIDVNQKEVEGKKQKLQGRINKLNKDISVMKQQVIDAETQIQAKVRQIEVSQDTINNKQTSLSVFIEQLKKNANEKDFKLKEQIEKDLRKTILNTRKQKRQAQHQQGKFIVELRRLYRQKKTLLRDIKAREEQTVALANRLANIEELTNLKVKEMKNVVAWMNTKLESREKYLVKLKEVDKNINETLVLLQSEFMLPNRKLELTETVHQMKKIKVHLLKQLKVLRVMLGARIAVYNKSKVVRTAYETRRDRLGSEEKKYREESFKLTKKISQLRAEVQAQTTHLKKQTVEVLRDIAAAKLSELRGELAGRDSQMRKIQRKLSLLDKAQVRAKRDYDEDLRKINNEFQKTKMLALKKARKDAVRDRRRLERRIMRIEKAMTDNKYTAAQKQEFADKAAALRKKIPEANQNVKKASERVANEEKKMKLLREKHYKQLQEIAKKLKEKEDALANESNVLREKISQTTNKLEKSGLEEDFRDVNRRLAAARAKANVAARIAERFEHKILAYMKNDLRGERKMVRVLTKSKEKTLRRIEVLKPHKEYNTVVDELQTRVEELTREIEVHKKNVGDLETKVAEATRKINDDIKLNIVAVKGQLDRLRARKDEIADTLNRILKSSKKDSISELKTSTKRMKQLKGELTVINKEEARVRNTMEQLNKVLFIRNLDEKTDEAARKSRKLIAAMKKSSRKVRRLRSKLVHNKRLINKLYRSVHETGDIISERAEDKMEQLKNVRAVLKNQLKKVMYDHKKIQVLLLKHVERVKRLSKFRIHNFHKQHSELLAKRNRLMAKKAQIKKEKGSEYFYTQIDLLDEKLNDNIREERSYKLRIQKKLNKMTGVAKECEKKTPTGLEGIKVKCTMCRNLAAFMLQKIRRDNMTRKEVMKKLYNRCEKSVDQSLCLRTALKLSTQAFQEQNKDLTPKELCYKVGRCVLKV